MEVEEQIEELSKALDEAVTEIEKLTSELITLNNKPQINQNTFWKEEQELSQIKDKLQTLQTEKDNCSLGLNKKVEELKNSNLSKEEIANGIIKLFSESKKGLDNACHRLSDAWINCGKIQERLNQVLEQRLKENQWVIKQQEESKKRMAISIYGLLGVVILLSLSLSLSLYTFANAKRQKKKDKK